MPSARCCRNQPFRSAEKQSGLQPMLGRHCTAPRAVGRKQALEMFLTGEMLDAQEASRIGLVNAVSPSSELLSAPVSLAWKAAETWLVAVKRCLDSLLQGLEMSRVDALPHEAAVPGLAATTTDALEGMTALSEKRKPVFQDK
ncbi:MAG: hypothetical protein JSU72_15980 [Deltaproteobacteria bacterium]|nr:MAG: hypothetical protein JSU72_15980 [Deltaproteobacteria bacterium]